MKLSFYILYIQNVEEIIIQNSFDCYILQKNICFFLTVYSQLFISSQICSDLVTVAVYIQICSDLVTVAVYIQVECPDLVTVCVDLSDWDATRAALSLLPTMHGVVNNAGTDDNLSSEAKNNLIRVLKCTCLQKKLSLQYSETKD